MTSRKSSLTALPFNCGSQEPDNIILVKDNGLSADLISKGYFGLAFHCVRHGTLFELHGEQTDGRRQDYLNDTMRDAIF
jgi:hypothetical protein